MRQLLVLILLCASAQNALAAKDPCDKFKDADAYNNCLAGFGPAAGPHKSTRAPDAEEQAAPAHHARSYRARHSAGGGLPPGFVRKSARKGRVRVEFRLR
jgi:hypothetical protein